MGANPYQVQAATTANPAQLVLMLYDGTLTAMGRAQTVGQDSSLPATEVIATVNRELQRAQDILVELLVTLDTERGGQVAKGMAALYDFCIDRLIRANVSKDLELLPPAVRVLRELRDAWEAACCEAPVVSAS